MPRKYIPVPFSICVGYTNHYKEEKMSFNRIGCLSGYSKMLFRYIYSSFLVFQGKIAKRLRRRKALLHCPFYAEHGCGRLHQLGPDLLRHTDEPPALFPVLQHGLGQLEQQIPRQAVFTDGTARQRFVREGMSIWERNRRNFSADTFSYSSSSRTKPSPVHTRSLFMPSRRA